MFSKALWVFVLSLAAAVSRAQTPGAGPGPALVGARTVPAADFAADPQIEWAQVSPGNDQVAMIVRKAEGTAGLAVKSLLDDSPPRLLVHYGNVDVVWVRWVSDKRLVFYV